MRPARGCGHGLMQWPRSSGFRWIMWVSIMSPWTG
nr:MAG TPA: hypothetical protein [Caudoviricetes sp.]